LTLKADGAESRIVISFHGMGSAFHGLLAGVCYFVKEKADPSSLSEEFFLVSYSEPQKEAVQRYTEWLDRCLIQGLARWRRTLV
jgi:hypothetical protein